MSFEDDSPPPPSKKSRRKSFESDRDSFSPVMVKRRGRPREGPRDGYSPIKGRRGEGEREGYSPLRAKRRQSDAKWRASVSTCYDTLKYVVPNMKQMSKRKISKALILGESERHIEELERKINEIIEVEAPSRGKALLWQDGLHWTSASIDKLKTDFSGQQRKVFHCATRGRRCYNLLHDIKEEVFNMKADPRRMAFVSENVAISSLSNRERSGGSYALRHGWSGTYMTQGRQHTSGTQVNMPPPDLESQVVPSSSSSSTSSSSTCTQQSQQSQYSQQTEYRQQSQPSQYSEQTEYSQQIKQNEYDSQDFEFSLQSKESQESLEREYNQQSQEIEQSQQDENEEMDFLAESPLVRPLHFPPIPHLTHDQSLSGQSLSNSQRLSPVKVEFNREDQSSDFDFLGMASSQEVPFEYTPIKVASSSRTKADDLPMTFGGKMAASTSHHVSATTPSHMGSGTFQKFKQRHNGSEQEPIKQWERVKSRHETAGSGTQAVPGMYSVFKVKDGNTGYSWQCRDTTEEKHNFSRDSTSSKKLIFGRNATEEKHNFSRDTTSSKKLNFGRDATEEKHNFSRDSTSRKKINFGRDSSGDNHSFSRVTTGEKHNLNVDKTPVSTFSSGTREIQVTPQREFNSLGYYSCHKNLFKSGSAIKKLTFTSPPCSSDSWPEGLRSPPQASHPSPMISGFTPIKFPELKPKMLPENPPLISPWKINGAPFGAKISPPELSLSGQLDLDDSLLCLEGLDTGDLGGQITPKTKSSFEKYAEPELSFKIKRSPNSSFEVPAEPKCRKKLERLYNSAVVPQTEEAQEVPSLAGELGDLHESFNMHGDTTGDFDGFLYYYQQVAPKVSERLGSHSIHSPSVAFNVAHMWTGIPQHEKQAMSTLASLEAPGPVKGQGSPGGQGQALGQVLGQLSQGHMSPSGQSLGQLSQDLQDVDVATLGDFMPQHLL